VTDGSVGGSKENDGTLVDKALPRGRGRGIPVYTRARASLGRGGGIKPSRATRTIARSGPVVSPRRSVRSRRDERSLGRGPLPLRGGIRRDPGAPRSGLGGSRASLTLLSIWMTGASRLDARELAVSRSWLPWATARTTGARLGTAGADLRPGGGVTGLRGSGTPAVSCRNGGARVDGEQGGRTLGKAKGARQRQQPVHGGQGLIRCWGLFVGQIGAISREISGGTSHWVISGGCAGRGGGGRGGGAGARFRKRMAASSVEKGRERIDSRPNIIYTTGEIVRCPPLARRGAQRRPEDSGRGERNHGARCLLAGAA